jgi:hypothetical protein
MLRLWTVIGLVFLCGLGARPYLWMLPLWPVSRDATLWITNAVPSAEWVDWVFRTNHFGVGYRPVTAISYTLDYLAGGFAALPYRLTDLGLHLLCVLLVYLLYRRLAPELPRWGGFVAAALFAAHPVVDQVVPQLARRSYSLATALSLAALLVLCPGRDRRAGSGPGVLVSVVGGLLLACAALAHEAVYVVLPVALLMLFQRFSDRPDRWRRLAVAGLLPVVFTVCALVLRSSVVEGVGGYDARGSRIVRAAPIAAATWNTLTAAAPMNEDPTRKTRPLVLVGSVLIGLYYLWRGAAGRNRHLVLLLAWFLAFLVVYSVLGVWFPRQVYLALPPFVLLVSVLLVTTIQGRKGNSRLWWGHVGVQGLLIGSILVHSPLLLGSDPSRVAAWGRTDTMLRGLHETLSDPQSPTDLGLVLPHFERPYARAFRARSRLGRAPIAARQVELWMKTVLPDRELKIKTFLVYRLDPRGPGPAAEFREIAGRPVAMLAPDVVYHRLRRATEIEDLEGRTAVWLDTVAHMYFHDGARGRLVSRAAPVEATP